MSQSINLRAVQWAYAQEGLSATSKAVLMTFAIHADQRGYTWPGVDHIATKWGMDKKTVRRQIESLLVRRMIRRTNKKRGATGQVKVYRLPKITYERGGKCTPFENEQRVPKESHKSPISGGEFPPNNVIMEQKKKDDELITLGTSVPAASDNASASSPSFSLSHQHQNQSAQSHIKWSEFAAYCASQKGKRTKNGRIHDGIPTEGGFWKWLPGQKPYWRDKVRPSDHIDGYVLDGKFFTAQEANRMGGENPELLTKFRKAIKRSDKTQIIDDPPLGFTQKSA
jgi:helix-turn-helix protein